MIPFFFPHIGYHTRLRRLPCALQGGFLLIPCFMQECVCVIPILLRHLKGELFIVKNMKWTLPHGPAAPASQRSLHLRRAWRTTDGLGTRRWKNLMGNLSKSPPRDGTPDGPTTVHLSAKQWLRNLLIDVSFASPSQLNKVQQQTYHKTPVYFAFGHSRHEQRSKNPSLNNCD